MASTDKLSKRVSDLRRKLTRAETEVKLLAHELARTEQRYKLAVAGSKVEAKK